jgi:rhodanese-related sulfurtransferase
LINKVTGSLLIIFITCLSALAIIPVGQSPASSPAASSDGIPRITIQELKTRLDNHDKVVVVDVRKTIDSKIKGAIHLPYDEIAARLNTLPKDRLIVTTCGCYNEGTSGRAAILLKQKGYNAVALKGGQRAWEEAKYPIEQVIVRK